MSILPALGQYPLEIIVQPVSLAPSDLERTLLTTENVKLGACLHVVAYLHVVLSCSCIDCETQGTGG
jgi:hypothetical protein